jgi:uncharacterized membrane protein
MRPTLRSTVGAFCAALPVLLAGASLALPAQAQRLAVVPVGLGAVTSLSADGTAATGQFLDDYQTFRWSLKGGQVGLGRSTWTTLSVTGGIPRISSDGRTVGSSMLSFDGTRATAGRWTVDGGWQELATPLPPGGGVMDSTDSNVFGMSRDGRVVTGLFWRPGQSGGSAHGSAWTAESGMLDMGSDGNSSRIDGSNTDGSVLVGWDEHPVWGNRRATVWVRGGKMVLDNTDWPSEAQAVNADGTIIVGQAVDEANQREAAVMWRWNGQGWTKQVLGVVPQSAADGTAYANGLSDDGSIVVGIARRHGNKPRSVGFVWTPATGMQEATSFLKERGITVRGLDLYSVPAITPNGRVLAAVGSEPRPPYAIRSVLIRLADGQP